MCWRLDLLTTGSCEDYLWSGRALVEFADAMDAHDFLERVVGHAGTELRRRALEGGDAG